MLLLLLTYFFGLVRLVEVVQVVHLMNCLTSSVYVVLFTAARGVLMQHRVTRLCSKTPSQYDPLMHIVEIYADIMLNFGYAMLADTRHSNLAFALLVSGVSLSVLENIFMDGVVMYDKKPSEALEGEVYTSV